PTRRAPPARLSAADPDDRRTLRQDLAKQKAALSVLWRLLDHARPNVRLDAAAALAEAVGDPPDYDPLLTGKERLAAIEHWKADVARRGARL
ncbi:MAG: hypothetical protein AAB263_04440, partial [Planctomycetota bacterium]